MNQKLLQDSGYCARRFTTHLLRRKSDGEIFGWSPALAAEVAKFEEIRRNAEPEAHSDDPNAPVPIIVPPDDDSDDDSELDSDLEDGVKSIAPESSDLFAKMSFKQLTDHAKQRFGITITKDLSRKEALAQVRALYQQTSA